MKFFKFPIVPVLFGFIIGILIQHFCNLPFDSILVGILCSAIGFAITYFLNIKKKFQSYFFESFVLVLSLAFGMFSTYLHKEINAKSHFLNFLSEKNIVQGVVSEKLKSTVYYDKFILKTTSVNQQNCSGKIIFYVPKKAVKVIEVGNKIKFFETRKYFKIRSIHINLIIRNIYKIRTFFTKSNSKKPILSQLLLTIISIIISM